MAKSLRLLTVTALGLILSFGGLGFAQAPKLLVLPREACLNIPSTALQALRDAGIRVRCKKKIIKVQEEDVEADVLQLEYEDGSVTTLTLEEFLATYVEPSVE
jgi:hypothetical protein